MVKETEKIYLDYAATTPTRQEVIDEMLPFFKERFGNPSSIHLFGRDVKPEIEKARERVASAIGADEPSEVVFLSGGTEADNTAIIGTLAAHGSKGKHVITSSFEHHAVLETCEYLEKNGFEVTYLPVGKDGLLDPDDFKKAIRPDTVIATIMHANNEIGTIQPIKQLAEIARERNVIFHTDAVQTAGILEFDVNELGVDMASFSAHKFYGPKGIGALYVRSGAKVEPYLHGGHQEKRRRAGTENVPGIIGFGKAFELAALERKKEVVRQRGLRDRLLDSIISRTGEVYLNGDREQRLPGNLNVSIAHVEGEALLLNLDMLGIAASTGSACTSDTLEPSHVLKAIGVPLPLAHGSLRFSLGKFTTSEEIDFVSGEFPKIVEKLRAISPTA